MLKELTQQDLLKLLIPCSTKELFRMTYVQNGLILLLFLGPSEAELFEFVSLFKYHNQSWIIWQVFTNPPLNLVVFVGKLKILQRSKIGRFKKTLRNRHETTQKMCIFRPFSHLFLKVTIFCESQFSVQLLSFCMKKHRFVGTFSGEIQDQYWPKKPG